MVFCMPELTVFKSQGRVISPYKALSERILDASATYQLIE
jgi:hypothetical protein